jgi:alpha-D-ribose 1-methylphosphonate 5-triphosphate diphosphatase PhnM
MTETILTNARIVRPDKDENGTLVIEDGRIADILPHHIAGGIDLEGAFLIPGVIDIHTDYLEREIAPRPTAKIPIELALHVMDLRALSCGLTTVCSAARISEEREGHTGSWRGDGLAFPGSDPGATREPPDPCSLEHELRAGRRDPRSDA